MKKMIVFGLVLVVCTIVMAQDYGREVGKKIGGK